MGIRQNRKIPAGLMLSCILCLEKTTVISAWSSTSAQSMFFSSSSVSSNKRISSLVAIHFTLRHNANLYSTRQVASTCSSRLNLLLIGMWKRGINSHKFCLEMKKKLPIEILCSAKYLISGIWCRHKIYGKILSWACSARDWEDEIPWVRVPATAFCSLRNILEQNIRINWVGSTQLHSR